MSKTIVAKHNTLINASYNLELVEQRLILLAIVEARRANKSLTQNDCLTVTADSYVREFKTSRQDAYTVLKQASAGLFERRFSYNTTENGEPKHVISRWVSQIEYLDGTGTVKIHLPPAVIEMVTTLERHFTSYDLEQVAELNSKYAVRLYEILKAWLHRGNSPKITVADLRERLGVLNGEYQRMELFKRKVLDLAVSQINEKTHLTLTYEQHKQGRKIVAFTFTVSQKATAKPPKTLEYRDPDTADLFSGLTDQEQAVITAKADEYIAYKQSKGETVDGFHRQNILQKAIDEQWGIAELRAEQAQEQAYKARREQQRAIDEQNRQEQAEREIRALERKQSVIAKFESLTPQEQQIALDTIAGKIGHPMLRIFNEQRTKNEAHKDGFFTAYFANYFGM